MGHKSGQCKTPGCNKDQWKDGYCRNCAQYAIQKETITGLTTATQLLVQVAQGLKRVEENISDLRPLIENNAKSQTVIKETVIQSPTLTEQKSPENKDHIDRDDSFIPTIEPSKAVTQIVTSKTSTGDKNITQLAKKLSQTKIGG